MSTPLFLRLITSKAVYTATWMCPWRQPVLLFLQFTIASLCILDETIHNLLKPPLSVNNACSLWNKVLSLMNGKLPPGCHFLTHICKKNCNAKEGTLRHLVPACLLALWPAIRLYVGASFLFMANCRKGRRNAGLSTLVGRTIRWMDLLGMD